MFTDSPPHLPQSDTGAGSSSFLTSSVFLRMQDSAWRSVNIYSRSERRNAVLTFWFANNTHILAPGNPSTCGPSHRPKCRGVNLLPSSDGVLLRERGGHERTLAAAWPPWERRPVGWSRGLALYPAAQQALRQKVRAGDSGAKAGLSHGFQAPARPPCVRRPPAHTAVSTAG